MQIKECVMDIWVDLGFQKEGIGRRDKRACYGLLLVTENASAWDLQSSLL